MNEIEIVKNGQRNGYARRQELKALKIKSKEARETEQREEATRRSDRRESIRKELFTSEPDYVSERKLNKSISSR